MMRQRILVETVLGSLTALIRSKVFGRTGVTTKIFEGMNATHRSQWLFPKVEGLHTPLLA